MSSTPRRALVAECATYVAAVLAVATGLALALPGQDADNPGPVQVLTMVTPLAVYLVLARIGRARVGFRRLGWKPAVRSWPAAVVLPLIAVVPAYVLADLLGWCELDGIAAYVAVAPITIAALTVLSLGEEIGWRGYLLGRLQQLTTRRRAAVAVGFVHGIFHVPLLVLTNSYDSDGSRWIVVPGVVALITVAGVIFAWLRDRSGSLWPVAIAHATINTFLLGSAGVMETDHPDRMAYLTGEGGLLTIATTAVLAAALLRRPWPQAASHPSQSTRRSLLERPDLVATGKDPR